MMPFQQIVVGGNDPLLDTGSLNEQMQALEMQKCALEARQRQIQQIANQAGQQQLPQMQQQPEVSIWDKIDAEIEPLTMEQRNMLASNEEYVNNYNTLQSMVQAEVLNLVRAKIENSPEGKSLLENQFKLVKNLKSTIVEMSNKEMEVFKAFREASAKNPNLTYEEFIKTMK